MKKGAYVDGLIEEQVTSVMETYQLLKIGSRNRHVSSTSMNKESSRSHSVFSMNIESKSNFDGLVNFKSSRFNLIDLAGSERQKSTACVGERLKEAGMINKSLSALGNVINSLVELSEGKPRHVPYRDSKLTFLLKDSLGGNSKTFIIANISPAVSAFSETLSSLKFAQRAKLIKNSAVINEDTSGTVQLLKTEVKRLREELESVKEIAELAVAQCPKCAGINQLELPNLLKSFEKNTEADLLLETNLRLRIENDKKMLKIIDERDKVIETLKSVVNRMENKANHDKMILKFRNTTIAKLQNGEEDKDTSALKKEIELLREEIENNPITAKLSAETKILNEEMAEMKMEFDSGFESTKQENTELKEFTEKLCESLKISNSEREKLKKIFTEISGGKDFDTIFGELEEKYEKELIQAKDTIRDLKKENSQILAENRMIHENYMQNFEGEDNLLDCNKLEELVTNQNLPLKGEDDKHLHKKLEKREKEIEELKLKLVTETQAKDVLFIEKRTLEKTFAELNDENTSLKILKEKYTMLESELEFTKHQYEEKYTEFVLISQELDNLTESAEYLKSNISELNANVTEKKQKINNLEHSLALLEKQSSEQAAMIIALQDPTGNKTLALALSECEYYKGKCLDQEQEIIQLKRTNQEALASIQMLTKSNEDLNMDLNTSKAAIFEMKDMLAQSKKHVADLKESEQNLLDEVEGLKEIVQREKHHGDIQRERLMNKHNEALHKLNSEKTELIKEIDTMKISQLKTLFEVNELRNKEREFNAKLANEVKKTERITLELIEAKVVCENQKGDIEKEKDKAIGYQKQAEKIYQVEEKLENIVKEKEGIISLLNTKDSEVCEWKDKYNKAARNLQEVRDKLRNEEEKNFKMKDELEMSKAHSEELTEQYENQCKNVENMEKSTETLQNSLKAQENTLKSLQNLNNELRNSLNTFQNVQKTLENTNKTLISQLEALEIKTKILENDKKVLEDSLAKNSSIINENDIKIKSISTELDKEITKNKCLNLELEAVKVAQEEVLKKYNHFVSKYAESEKKLQAEREKLQEISFKLDESIVENEKFAQEIYTMREHTEIVNNEKRILEEKHMKKEEELKAALDLKAMMIEGIKKEIDEKNKDFKDLIGEKNEFLKVISIKNGEISVRDKEISIKNKEVREKEAKIQELIKEKNDILMEVNEKDVELKEKFKKIQEMAIENNNFVVVINQKNAEIKEKDKEIADKERENCSKDKEIRERDTKIQEINIEKNNLLYSLNQKSKEISYKDKELQENFQKLQEESAEKFKLHSLLLQKNSEIQIKDKELNDKNQELNKKSKEITERTKDFIEKSNLLTAKLAELSEKNEDLIIKDQDLKHKFNELIEKDTEIIERDKKISELLDENDEKSQKILNLQNQLKSLNQSNESSKIINEKQKSEIEDLFLQKQIFQSSATEFQLKNSELFDQIEEKNIKYKELEHTCIKLINEKEQKSILIESLNIHINELQISLDQEKRGLEEKVVSLFVLQNENDDLKFAYDKVKEINNKILAEIDLKNLQIQDLEVKMTEANQEITHFKQVVQEKTEEIMSLARKNMLVEAKLADMHDNLSKSFEFQEENSEKLSKLTEEYMKTLDYLEKANKKGALMQSELKKASEMALEMQKILENKDLTLQNAQEIIESQLKAIETLKSEISLAENSLKAIKFELESLKNAKNLEISLLNSKFQSIQSENYTLQSSNKEQQNELLQKSYEITALANEKSSLTVQITDMYSSQDILRKELDMSQKEVKILKEELKQKNEVIKNTNLNANNTREEIATWKKCIEEKNLTIGELKKEIEDLKIKSNESVEIQNSINTQRKEFEKAAKMQTAMQSELKNVKGELFSSLEARESLMQDLKSLRDDEIRYKKDILDAKKTIVLLKEDNLRFLKEITKLNDENLRLSDSESSGNSGNVDRYRLKIKKLESDISSLEAQVKIKNTEIEKYSKRLAELHKKGPEGDLLRKEIEKQAEEINNLTEGLSRITEYVFSLPLNMNDPEDTSIIDCTIKAIKQLYTDLQNKEKEINEKKVLRKGEGGSQSTGIFKPQAAMKPMLFSPTDKNSRVQSPSNRSRGFK
ncbi:hypothetical protein SteCoe_28884 [Stentor coeruleus]|uniref:Kinesin motor domain-containing protein n=1 Tax=Stentor coeruleus TaxID=5963 RepID=A0A1R2B776_9CILI|nr:hypothetical protein SteCoe_28884 [Stentor coeruleus]